MRGFPELPFRLFKTKVVVNRPKNWQICGFIIVLGHHHPLSLRNSRQRCREKRRFWSRQTTKIADGQTKIFSQKHQMCLPEIFFPKFGDAHGDDGGGMKNSFIRSCTLVSHEILQMFHLVKFSSDILLYHLTPFLWSKLPGL